ncbi:hypothetical protein SAMN05444003_0955 [Cognatiyoonia sediminum]|uniref:Ancillary SecYEG translocon subunit/Cell division coordinator CpoB TPR domain-containing protein n=1 Tax=Cognatiyoonia sediminum TaxID=1508389 RepID=A0A1M5MQG8_9RHOB|nr:tetratricopeptide repeat protein [Cognatiyoonia sediminum]SHG79447.1 hypothetical protein SAMN05444003_0955 [Cognatiyoonia sediminum]
MSDTDSFINEVTEEVQRDKLYGYVRRYGWIAALLIIGLVGGAAWNEYHKASAVTLAENTGDALMDALELNDIFARPAALADVTGEGPAVAVTALATAAAQQEAGNLEAAAATLNELAINTDVPPIYADLAAFKLALIDTGDDAARRALLEGLAQPGEPFNLLAQEQLAYMDLSTGNQDAAVTTLRAIIEDAGVTRGLRDRAQTMIVALGEELEPSPTE